MARLLDELNAGKIMLCDGAMGTELHGKGLAFGACPEGWNLSHPELVRDVCLEYIAAGSDIVETNTLGGTHFRLSHFGLANRVLDINRTSAELAKDAAGRDHYVFGSVGPTGQLMKPFGGRNESELIAAFSEQIESLVQGGIDAVCIETQISLDEALAATKAARQTTHVPVVVTMTFNKTAAGEFRTIMGESVGMVVERLSAAGVDVLGSNCGWGPDQMLELCQQFRPLTDLPLMFQPNAGLPSVKDGHTLFQASPTELADACTQLCRAGANIIGGCCGTTPNHIKSMRTVLDRD